MTTPQAQGEWYQFDPNVHYYYDEQGQLHYYDPNTNLEYDYQPQYQQQQQQSAYYQQYTNTSTPQSYTPIQPQQADISRQATPDVLMPCPDPNCNGENKPTSKFCEECGRSLGAISRSATPGLSTNNMSSLTRAFSNQQISDNQLAPPQRPPTAPIYSSSPLDSVQTVPLYHPPSTGSTHLYYNNVQHQSMQDIYTMQQQQQQRDQHLNVSQQYNAYYQQQHNSFQQQQQYQQPATDPLDRARGCPIVSFGFGGKMLVTFPRTVANYYSSTVKPQPGPIKIKSLNIPVPAFPGPVLLDPKVGTKQKKKDVVQYINTMVDEFEKEKLAVVFNSLEFHRLQGKILLYQILKVMIETDGKVNDK